MRRPVPAVGQSDGNGQPLTTAALLGGGWSFSAVAPGAILPIVTIQATTNPADPSTWTDIGSIQPTNSPFTFTDPQAAQFPSRFYRVVTP